MKDMVLLPPTSSPSAANGSRLQCVGEVVTTIKIGHVTRPSVRVLVVDKLNSPAILGVDVLRNYDNVTIDWEAQVLHLGGYSIPLEDRLLGAPRQPTEVCLVSDTVIPARSQCFITAASKDFGTMPQETIFVPYQDKMAKQNVLLGAGVVVRSIKNEIPILVMNNSASPIKLYNGTSIGHLSTVTVQDEEEETKRPKVTERRVPANVDLSDSCLTAKQKEAVKRVLSDFRDTFANDVTEVGKTDRINFEIDTNNHPPVALKLRRTPFALRDEVDRQIREMEERGHTRDKEAFALVYALRKFRQYLLGRKFIWYTDHLGLRWLRNTRDPRGRYARWVEQIEEFEFETCYRAGQLNQHADALSRKLQQQNISMVSPSVRFSAEVIKTKQEHDPVLSQVITHLRLSDDRKQPLNPKVRTWMRKRDTLFLDKTGMLYIKFRRGRKILNQLVVPDSLVPDVLQLKHDEAGHMSSSKTRKLIQREYYWLSVNEDTRRYCQTCSVCATCKDPPRETTTDANLTSQPTEPWQEVSMDLKGPFGPQSTSRGNRYLLVVLDLLTRAAEMIPIPNKTAKTVANAVVTEVFCRHGIPESILTDKGLEFDSSAMLVLATELGIDKKRPLHPQANGAVERLNRTIGQMLKKTQEENDLDWDLKISFVRFNQEHSSTGYSPFYLTFGRNPRTPVLVKDSSMPKPKTPQQWATDLAKTLKEAHDVSSTRDRLQKEKRAEKSKEVLTTQRFKVGDEVLVYSPTRKGQVKSLHRAWAGPYIVIQCREGNTYRIKNSNNFRQRFIRHHDQLRYLHSRPLHLTKPSQADVTDDKPVHDIQPSGVPKKPTTSTNAVPPSTSLPTFGDSDDESDEDSDNGEGEPQENGEAPGGSTEPETARIAKKSKTKAGAPTLWR
ncbi:hypothetical protein QZH41_008905, partial [Actinostola sp. cb2023]